VDSGNLGASFIALKEGCFELLEGSPAPQPRWGGLIDTVNVLLETVEGPLGTDGALPAHLRAMRSQLHEGADRPEVWPALFQRLESEGMAELRRLLAEAMEAGSLGPAERQA